MKKILILLLAILAVQISAQTYYWDGGGTNNNWSTAANWAISNGAGGYINPASAPSSSTHTVIFDGGAVAGGASANKNCTINGSYTVGSFTINGYIGTITLSSSVILAFSSFSQSTGVFAGLGSINSTNANLVIGGTAVFSISKTLTIGRIIVNGGTFTAGSSPINVSNSMSLSGGSFTSTSGTMALQGNFSMNSGSFNHNNGTVAFSTFFNTTGKIADLTGTLNFYNLQFNNAFSGTTVVTWTLDNFRVSNNLTIINGLSTSTRTTVFNTGTISLYGNLIITGTSTARTQTTSGTATIRMLGSTSKTITTNNSSYRQKRLPNVSIANTAGVLVTGSLGVQNMTIEPGGVLSVTSDTIAVLGDFINNGTFNANTGILTFDCNLAISQTLKGSTITTFNDIAVHRSVANEVLLGSTQRIKGKFFLRGNNSHFNTNNNTFIFLSSATSTASIWRITTGSSFTGSIVYQRYIPARAGRYYYQMGAPVAGAQFWNIKTNVTTAPPNPDNGVFITGWSINGHNPDIASIGLKNTATPSIKSLNATTGAEESPSNITNTMVSGKGYQVFIRDGGVDLAPNTGAKLLYFRGTPNTGTFNFNLGYSPSSGDPKNGPIGGWNFIANPYPADITADLSTAGWVTTAANLVDNTVYQFDPDAKAFITCLNGTGSVGTTGNSTSRACIISSAHGFQVRTTAAGTLTANETAKISISSYGNGQSILRAERLGNTLDVSLTNKETGIAHGTLLRFLNEATSSKDVDYDAYDLRAEAPFVSIASILNNEYFSINSVNTNFDDTIGLSVSYPAGAHVLSFANNTLDGSYRILLKDKLLNTEQDVTRNPIYEFNALKPSNAFDNRFVLVIRNSANNLNKENANTQLIALYPNPSNDGRVSIKTFDNNVVGGVVKVTNIEGQTIYTQNISTQGIINLEKDLTSGIYFVKIETDNNTITEKLIVK